MKVYELMSYSAPLLRQLNTLGVKAEDIKHLPMMLRYEEMKPSIKKVAIVKILSEEFGVSERAIYDIIARLNEDI